MPGSLWCPHSKFTLFTLPSLTALELLADLEEVLDLVLEELPGLLQRLQVGLLRDGLRRRHVCCVRAA